MVVSGTINLKTNGETDIIDITGQVKKLLMSSGLNDGTATVFVPGSTGGLTTIEFEPGVVKDVKEAFERIAPREDSYAHNTKWGDGNGFSHVRAALMGPSLNVPFKNNILLLGTWQQIVFIDFDNKPRNREIMVQLIGE